VKVENPAFDYDKLGQKYSGYRQTDPRIAKYVFEAFAGVRIVLNIGAGAGLYEPTDKHVVAVEPPIVMRTQRLQDGKISAVNAKAANLPFNNNSFDASMAMVTIHHWPEWLRV